MRIDFHTHCFPDALAPRAMEILTKNCSARKNIRPHTNGTAADTKRLLMKTGVSLAVVCNIATNPHQEKNVNSFAISLKQQDSFFYPLGSVHPDSTCMEKEIDRLKAAGIGGIKLHPDYVDISVTDARFGRIFDLLEERDMFAVVHAGYDPVSPEDTHATPAMLREVMDKRPHLKLVAAHMGGFCEADDVLSHLVGTPIYLDTSLSSLRPDEQELLHRILKEHPTERILYGSDIPWSNAEKEVAFVENAPLTEAQKALIFEENAKRLLKI